MNATTQPVHVVILGAAGRDFHNFNVVYRDDPNVEVVAFTATQIPGIAARRYPPALAGSHYPQGIPIVAEEALEQLCRDRCVDEVVFAYSDVAHEQVMHLASRALACGADFRLLGPRRTMLDARVPVIAVSAVRTGCGKSQTTRYLSRRLREGGHTVVVMRHPMPYGDLERERVQRFARPGDLAAACCTIEEREEYEPHIALGNVVYAGVDYAAILAEAEREAEVILWDGGNNDFPFVRPDVHIVLADALRAGQESQYHPGETVVRMADIVLVAKSDAARRVDVALVARNVRAINAGAVIVYGASPVALDHPQAIAGKRVLAIEDGPTVTHGGMPYGAAYVAALHAGAAEIVDPRPYASPELAAVYARYPHLGPVLPAMGYSDAELAALRETVRRVPADAIVVGTPADIATLLNLDRCFVRARYEYAETGTPGLWEAVESVLARKHLLVS